MKHTRFEFSPIANRKPVKLPNEARVALWVIPNLEHFHFDQPSTSIYGGTAGLKPDILNYSWRDYGVRVGVWRMMEMMKKYNIKGTAALNSEVCAEYPEIIQAGKELEWEWMGHGTTNSKLITSIEEAEERRLIKDVLDTIEESTGTRPKGWLGPALTETINTPDLLREEGIEYLADWVNDDQPYPMNVRNGEPLYSIPYSIEVNDITSFLSFGHTPEQFYQMLVDQFDVLYEEGKTNGRVMSICLHPFLIGHPFRSKYLEKAFSYITSHEGVWLATGSEIVDYFKTAHEKDVIDQMAT
ncbi:polysaccharide deacetylase family protein [Domibacillus epiphyticus]|uniref:Polysaccharide deacetylase n=1 Tax=Domibacillus epiphyticus TaxID=1714355 RepID=A0A1V2A8A9_9BACI|nr:polysaccharide deacetylase family protein [Domibacillus epiphyticus]OMP67228.1 polysaccharide deacetylase [Domibacillus epiphyticus]